MTTYLDSSIPEDDEHEMKYTRAEWLAHMEQQKMWDEVDAEETAMTPDQKAEIDKEQALVEARLDSYFKNTNTKRRGNYPASMAGDGQQASVAGPNLDGHVPNLGKPTPGLDMDTQYVKPREGDTIELKHVPKPGNSFDAWQDHLRDAVCACSAFGQSAFRWILEVEKEGAQYEDFQNPGNFVQLDQKLNAALNDCTPCDTHTHTHTHTHTRTRTHAAPKDQPKAPR